MGPLHWPDPLFLIFSSVINLALQPPTPTMSSHDFRVPFLKEPVLIPGLAGTTMFVCVICFPYMFFFFGVIPPVFPICFLLTLFTLLEFYLLPNPLTTAVDSLKPVNLSPQFRHLTSLAKSGCFFVFFLRVLFLGIAFLLHLSYCPPFSMFGFRTTH